MGFPLSLNEHRHRRGGTPNLWILIDTSHPQKLFHETQTNINEKKMYISRRCHALLQTSRGFPINRTVPAVPTESFLGDSIPERFLSLRSHLLCFINSTLFNFNLLTTHNAVIYGSVLERKGVRMSVIKFSKVSTDKNNHPLSEINW